MIRLERSIVVGTPPEDAFAYVADFTTSAEWDPGVDRATLLSDGPGVGARYHLVANFNGNAIDLTYETTVYDAPDEVVFDGGNKRFGSLDRIRFSPDGDGTRIDYVAEFRMKGVLRIVEPFLKRRFDTVADDAVAGLAGVLGQRAVS